MYLFISRFGFESGICFLIAPVPVYCFSITFENKHACVKRVTSSNSKQVVQPKKLARCLIFTGFLDRVLYLVIPDLPERYL